MSSYEITKIIEKKRDGGCLTKEEIKKFIQFTVSCNRNEIDKGDHSQIGAMLMAIMLRGLDMKETQKLTTEMRDSGHVFKWPEAWRHLVVDKHSTGGVGDKISIILAPALAALGLKIPMISGRSLSHTGGTLDKLESIPGLTVQLNHQQILELVGSVGCCIVGQTDDCCPADKVLYRTREITGTVSSSPLIVASIASKKLSEGLNSLVYDAKFGRGAIMDNYEKALETAKNLVMVSQDAKVSALLTSMEHPLGNTIGNSLELLEAVDCLRGRTTPHDIITLVGSLGAELLHSSKNLALSDGYKEVLSTLKNGSALEKFYLMIRGQGVNDEIAKNICYGDYTGVVQKSQYLTIISYTGTKGYITAIDPLVLANVWKEESSKSKNNGIGFVLQKNVGDYINDGDAWLNFFHDSNETLTEDQEAILHKSIRVSCEVQKQKILHKRIFCNQNLIMQIEDC